MWQANMSMLCNGQSTLKSQTLRGPARHQGVSGFVACKLVISRDLVPCRNGKGCKIILPSSFCGVSHDCLFFYHCWLHVRASFGSADVFGRALGIASGVALYWSIKVLHHASSPPLSSVFVVAVALRE